MDAVPTCGERLVHIYAGRLRHLIKQHAFLVSTAVVRHCLPNFIRGIGQNGRNQARHAIQNHIHSGLRCTAVLAVRLLHIETVLQHIEIEVRHIHHAEIVNRVIGIVEFIRLIGLFAFCSQCIQLCQRPTVDRLKLVERNAILIRVKIRKIAQDKARRVADLPIGVGELFENFLGNADIRMVIRGSHP